MIEWFLTPSSENERAIAYAMKLYSANKLGDALVDRFISSDDIKLDRSLKQLQVRDLASRQGLNPDKFMDDDANEMNRTAQGAIAYGAKTAKPKGSLFVEAAGMSLPAQQPRTVFKAALKSAGAESPGFFFKEAMRDLKALGGAATMGGRAKAIARYASVL
jgi:hypothetical protein